MALSRREFQLLMERVGKLETRARTLEEQIKVLDNRTKPAAIMRALRQEEEEEKKRRQQEDLMKGMESQERP
jgi:hypothetical protein